MVGAPWAGPRVAPQGGGDDTEWEGGTQGNGLEERMRSAQVRRKVQEGGLETCWKVNGTFSNMMSLSLVNEL